MLFSGRVSAIIIQSLVKRSLSRTSQRPRREPRHYRLWAMPGDYVLRKDILARQHTMKWHPGLNAGIDADRNIYALCEGVMIITEEHFDPDWLHPIVDKAYTKNSEKMAPQMSRYIHVLPKKRVSEFKLIDLV